MLGLIYVLIAMGLTLIFSILGLINFAHGEFYMLGGFALYWFFGQFGLNYWLGLVIGMILVGAFGMVTERFIFRPLRRDLLQACLASVGISIVLQTGALIAFGQLDKAVPSQITTILHAGTINVPLEKMVVVLGSALLTVALMFFIYRTKMGQALQAVSQDSEAAALQGINVDRMNAMGFAIGCALAAAAGGLISPVFYISPYMGITPTLKAFIVVIMGGLGSIPGAIIAGFFLAFLEQFSITMLGYVGNIFGFVMLMIVMTFRPQGFMGREFRVH